MAAPDTPEKNEDAKKALEEELKKELELKKADSSALTLATAQKPQSSPATPTPNAHLAAAAAGKADKKKKGGSCCVIS